MDSNQYPIQKQMSLPEFNALAAQLTSKEGLLIASTGPGTVSKDGVSIAYTFDGSTLGLNVLKTPPFMRNHVIGELKKALGIA